MANHCYIFKRGESIEKDDIIRAFHRINDEVFDSLLTIKEYDNGNLCILPDKSGKEGLFIYTDSGDYIEYSVDDKGAMAENVVARNYIDMRHGHGNDFYWWLDSVFTKKFMEILDAECYDEGVGEIKLEDMKPIETSFLSHLKKKWTSTSEPYEFLKDVYDQSLERVSLLEDNLSDKIYNTLITEKYKRRKEGIEEILNG